MLSELWEGMKPWLPWTVPIAVVVFVIVFTCFMVWPERTARAFGLLTVLGDSLARRFRKTPLPHRPPRRSGEPMPPTITGFAVPPVRKDDKPESD